MSTTGHLQVIDRAADRAYLALWRDGSGKRHKRVLGPAWVKPHGATARGAVRWRTADGPKPGPEWVTPREAETRLREILASVPAPPRPALATVSFREASEDWLRYLEVERERAATTVRDYRNVVRGALFPRFGADRPVNTITTADIDAYREDELRAGRIKRRTLQKNLVLLHGILKRAKRRGWVEYNAAADAERVTFKRSGDFNVLTPTQVGAVSAAAVDDLMRTVIVVAAYTGLRMGELRALRWRDVDFAKRSVFVRRNFTGGFEHAPKSGKIRSVPMVDQALVALDAQSRRADFTAPDDLVFGNAFGEHLYDYTIRNAFYDALDAAGLSALPGGEDPIVFHDLRHTFGTLAVQAFPLTDVKAYMGHEDISTTMIYVHHVPRHDAADKLSALLRIAAEPLATDRVDGGRT